MNRPTALGAVFAVFLVGVLGGVAGARFFYAQELEAKAERVPFLAPHYIGHLDRGLDLGPEQKEQIDQILREAHQEAEALRREVRPRIHQLMEEARESIKAVLTPEQLQRFEELPIHQRRWRGPRGRRGHGPPKHLESPGRRRGSEKDSRGDKLRPSSTVYSQESPAGSLAEASEGTSGSDSSKREIPQP